MEGGKKRERKREARSDFKFFVLINSAGSVCKPIWSKLFSLSLSLSQASVESAGLTHRFQTYLSPSKVPSLLFLSLPRYLPSSFLNSLSLSNSLFPSPIHDYSPSISPSLSTSLPLSSLTLSFSPSLHPPTSLVSLQISRCQ